MTDADRADASPGGGREQKGEVADRERAGRGYEETYGRDAGERFEEGDYARAYGVPDRLDWRRAVRAYVNGHDRGWEADRKYERAAAEVAGRPAGPREAGAEEAPVEEGSAPEEAATRSGEGRRYEITVPDRDELDFHRGASTWRDRLPRSPRMPRHADRTLDGQRGKGGQA